MGIVIRQSLKATIANYLAVVVGYLNLGYFFPKIFSTEEIGLISFILGTSTLLISIFQLGMPSAIVRFYPEIKEKKQEMSFLNFSTLVPILLFLILFSLLAFLSPFIITKYYSNSHLIKEYYFLVPIISFFMGLTGIWAAHCNSLLRIVVPTIIEKFLNRILVLFMITLALFYSLDFSKFINGYTVIYGSGLLLTLIYFYKIKPKYDKSNQKKLNNKEKKKILGFSSVSFLTIIGGRIVENIDIIMISSMIDLSSAGIYKIAFYIGGVIMIPLSSLGQISSPIFAQFWKKKKLDKISELYKKASINLILVGGLLFTGILINIQNIFKIMPNGQDYINDGIWIVLIIATGKMINMALSLNGHLLQNSKYFYVNTYSILILGLLTVLTNYIFIPMWGITGAAFASSVSLVIFNLIKFVFILIKFKMSPFSLKTIPAISVFIMLFIVDLFIPEISNVFADVMLRSFIVTLLFFILIYFLKISTDINNILDSYIKKAFVWKKKT